MILQQHQRYLRLHVLTIYLSVHVSIHLPIYLGPNVVFEWLTLLLHIREVLDSNLGPETGCPY
jgi:hypothetical protein